MLIRKFTESPDFVQEYILHTIVLEGHYVKNVYDSGGATKYGITEVLAREYGYKGRMEDLTLSLAKDIYATEFYFKPKLYLINSSMIQQEVFDSSVNVGSVRAITWLQKTLNVFNRRGDYYKDIVVDGIMGNQTKNALNAYSSLRGLNGDFVLLKALNCLQGSFYIELSEKREKDQEFTYGWIKNRIILPCEK